MLYFKNFKDNARLIKKKKYKNERDYCEYKGH